MKPPDVGIPLVEDSAAGAELALHALPKTHKIHRVHPVRDGEALYQLTLNLLPQPLALADSVEKSV
jgi:hypothetical protein